MFQDLKNKQVVIMGLGSYESGSGISATLFFAKQGAKILITDFKKQRELKNQIKRLKKFKNIKFVLGRHRKKDFERADFIFKNPGVPKNSPYLKIARKNGILVINDWTIFFEKRPKNLLIGITGTKGKSTTAVLLYEILKSGKKDAVLCGNIGRSPLAVLNKIKKDTIIIAELSSWLLQEFKSIKKSPQIAVITNLMPDHLDKYKNLQEYYKDKENIFKFQKANDYLLLNRDDKKLRNLAKKAKSRVIWFSGESHSAAIASAKLLGIPQKIIQKAVANFKSIPGRLELIREKNGVRYYNDTTATVPDAVIYALNLLKQYKGKIILIAGGADKKLDYKDFAKVINKDIKTLILFPGTATDKILKVIKDVQHRVLHTMKDAVEKAKSFAKRGDIVLLSPGAASFGLFKNEFDRGRQFCNAVKKL